MPAQGDYMMELFMDACMWDDSGSRQAGDSSLEGPLLKRMEQLWAWWHAFPL